MTISDYDIIAVGGGIAGSTTARVMAEHGLRVLVLEQEKDFKDRVRGEVTTSWGTAEAKALGAYELLDESCGHELPWLDVHIDGMPIVHRDLIETTPEGTPFYAFYHPAMQDVLLQAAEIAGAEVRRGVRVTNIEPGDLPTVTTTRRSGPGRIRARLVVGADGRVSRARRWAGFSVEKDPDRLLVSGVLFDSMNVPHDTAAFRMNTAAGQMTFWFPQRNGSVRSYVVYQADANYRLAGKTSVPRFIEESVNAGAAAQYYDGATAIGPLATFNGADTWVPHPYNDGVALVGDAAAASDASWGEGLSLALRDARLLTHHLLHSDDWEAAGHAYAEAHDRHYGVVHTVENWLTELFMDPGPVGVARRAKALPSLEEDLTRMPDLFGLGPETPVDDTVRRRFFGET